LSTITISFCLSSLSQNANVQLPLGIGQTTIEFDPTIHKISLTLKAMFELAKEVRILECKNIFRGQRKTEYNVFLSIINFH